MQVKYSSIELSAIMDQMIKLAELLFSSWEEPANASEVHIFRCLASIRAMKTVSGQSRGTDAGISRRPA